MTDRRIAARAFLLGCLVGAAAVAVGRRSRSARPPDPRPVRPVTPAPPQAVDARNPEPALDPVPTPVTVDAPLAAVEAPTPEPPPDPVPALAATEAAAAVAGDVVPEPAPAPKRRKTIVRASVLVGLVLAAVLVVAVGRSGGHPRAGSPPAHTASTETPPTDPASGIPEPVITADLPGGNPQSLYATPDTTAPPPVFWRLGGSCRISGDTTTCHVTVAASNGLLSAGVVVVYLTGGSGQVCSQSGPVVHDAVTLVAQCQFSPGPKVLAQFSVTRTSNKLASAYLSAS